MAGGRRALGGLALCLQLAVLLVYLRESPEQQLGAAEQAAAEQAAAAHDEARPALALLPAAKIQQVLPAHSIYSLVAQPIAGGPAVALSQFAGSVALVVNVASK